MSAEGATRIKTRKTHEICIDLPGESVQCWRSSDHVKVILRKHRDVFFDINVKPGATYLIESTSDFYSVRDKRLLRQSLFLDGERFHLWIGRNFKGKLFLKGDGLLIGVYEPNRLDPTEYDPSPGTKPEPLMVVLGKEEYPATFGCNVRDSYDFSVTQSKAKPLFDAKLALLKNYGTTFDYEYLTEAPLINEFVVVAEAEPNEIQDHVLTLLDAGKSVVGTITELFNKPLENYEATGIYGAILHFLSSIAIIDLVKTNVFKETAGYLRENWRMLDKIMMTVRIEKRVIGKYRVVFKGKPLSKPLSQILGASRTKIISKSYPLGSQSSSFIDGGFGKTGRAGYGGVKRLLITTAENFRSGAKVQAIGTIIDLCEDAYNVYYGKDGSEELSEFLGRAGVTLVKAGATAAIGAAFATLITMLLTAVFAAGAPVWLVAGLVIVGFIVAAKIVDHIDDDFNIKSNVAAWAR